MRFTYTYRSSDGQRHTAEIEAESRDAAFAAIRRELGVKPIRVVAAGGRSDVNGRDVRSPSGHTVAGITFAALVLLAVGGAIWWLAGRRRDAPYQVMTPHGPVTYTVATPLPRQAIPGDRRRIEAAMGGRDANGQDARSPSVFRSPAETYLARFAEPGRRAGDETISHAEHVEDGGGRKHSASSARLSPPAREDFEACLKEPIRVASTDFTEVVDLKRIVTGMKREMRAYLAGGGTVAQYLAELEKRQRLEISYRERAEQKLNTMLSNHDSSPGKSNKQSIRQSNNNARRAAYAYWLKANASLRAMGIHTLELPAALQTYQMSLDIESEDGVPEITQRARADGSTDGTER